jgi:ribonuclease P protein component
MVTRQTFSSSERMLKSGEFQALYKEGERLVTKYFVLFFIQDSKRLLGITVTRSIGKACERNRIKRLVRELFRTKKNDFPEGKLVVKARESASGMEGLKLRTDLYLGAKRLAKKLGKNK